MAAPPPPRRRDSLSIPPDARPPPPRRHTSLNPAAASAGSAADPPLKPARHPLPGMVPASGSPHEQSADDDRDRDAEEFERLAESRGLLGALGFAVDVDDPEMDEIEANAAAEAAALSLPPAADPMPFPSDKTSSPTTENSLGLGPPPAKPPPPVRAATTTLSTSPGPSPVPSPTLRRAVASNEMQSPSTASGPAITARASLLPKKAPPPAPTSTAAVEKEKIAAPSVAADNKTSPNPAKRKEKQPVNEKKPTPAAAKRSAALTSSTETEKRVTSSTEKEKEKKAKAPQAAERKHGTATGSATEKKAPPKPARPTPPAISPARTAKAPPTTALPDPPAPTKPLAAPVRGASKAARPEVLQRVVKPAGTKPTPATTTSVSATSHVSPPRGVGHEAEAEDEESDVDVAEARRALLAQRSPLLAFRLILAPRQSAGLMLAGTRIPNDPTGSDFLAITVARVETKGPAAQAGLLAGDIVAAIGSEQTLATTQAHALSLLQPAAAVSVVLDLVVSRSANSKNATERSADSARETTRLQEALATAEHDVAAAREAAANAEKARDRLATETDANLQQARSDTAAARSALAKLEAAHGEADKRAARAEAELTYLQSTVAKNGVLEAEVQQLRAAAKSHATALAKAHATGRAEAEAEAASQLAERDARIAALQKALDDAQAATKGATARKAASTTEQEPGGAPRPASAVKSTQTVPKPVPGKDVSAVPVATKPKPVPTPAAASGEGARPKPAPAKPPPPAAAAALAALAKPDRPDSGATPVKPKPARPPAPVASKAAAATPPDGDEPSESSAVVAVPRRKALGNGSPQRASVRPHTTLFTNDSRKEKPDPVIPPRRSHEAPETRLRKPPTAELPAAPAPDFAASLLSALDGPVDKQDEKEKASPAVPQPIARPAARPRSSHSAEGKPTAPAEAEVDPFAMMATTSVLNVAAGRARVASVSKAVVKRRPPSRVRSAAATANTSASGRERTQTLAHGASRPAAAPRPVARPRASTVGGGGAAATAMRNPAGRNDEDEEAAGGHADDGDDAVPVQMRPKPRGLKASLKRMSRRSISGDVSPLAAPIVQLETDSMGVQKWTPDDVCQWLAAQDDSDLAQYCDAFREQGVDGIRLLNLTGKDELKGLGVTKVGHRTVMKKLIADLLKATQA